MNKQQNVETFVVPKLTMKEYISYGLSNSGGTVAFSVLAEGTLCSMMTRDLAEREKLGSYRLGLCTIGHILAGGCTFPLIHLLYHCYGRQPVYR